MMPGRVVASGFYARSFRCTHATIRPTLRSGPFVSVEQMSNQPLLRGRTPITALRGRDNPAALVPVRSGERVIVGKENLPKLIGTDDMPMM